MMTQAGATTLADDAGILSRAERRRRTPLSSLFRFARRKPLGFIGLVLVVGFILLSLIAPAITPFDATKSVGRPLESPGSVDPRTGTTFWLGTDATGQDVLSRVMQGSQISLAVAFTVVTINVVLGTLLGLLAGFYQGPVDYIIQRSGEVWSAFPQLIALLLIVSVLGTPHTTGGNLVSIAWDLRNLIFAFSIGAVFGGSRVIRGITLSLKQNDYVLAARAVGARDNRIILQHILPNTLPIVIISATAGVGAVILGEAALSFLGLGVAPGTPSWGQDLSGRNRLFMLSAPWIVLAPGVAISLVVLGFNLYGDALRDILDPRLRGTRG